MITARLGINGGSAVVAMCVEFRLGTFSGGNNTLNATFVCPAACGSGTQVELKPGTESEPAGD